MTSLNKPLIIPFFIPHITSSGITSSGITSSGITSSGIKNNFPLHSELPAVVKKYLTYKGNRKEVQIAFYGGTFLGLQKDYIKSLLIEAAKFVEKGLVDSIRFSTRPDTINKETLELLKGFPVKIIELGVQSMDDSVLTLSGRGHTASDTNKAVELLKQAGYEIGLQMMIGLPGDSTEKAISSGKKIASLLPSFVRIYPTVVFSKSPLATLYYKGKYLPLNMDNAVSIAAELYLLFKKKNIPVIRMGLQEVSNFNDKALIAGPYHPAFGHLVFSKIFLDNAKTILNNMFPINLRSITKNRSLIIKVNSTCISKMRGLKNSNIRVIKEIYGFKKVNVIPNSKNLEQKKDKNIIISVTVHDQEM